MQEKETNKKEALVGGNGAHYIHELNRVATNNQLSKDAKREELIRLKNAVIVPEKTADRLRFIAEMFSEASNAKDEHQAVVYAKAMSIALKNNQKAVTELYAMAKNTAHSTQDPVVAQLLNATTRHIEELQKQSQNMSRSKLDAAAKSVMINAKKAAQEAIAHVPKNANVGKKVVPAALLATIAVGAVVQPAVAAPEPGFLPDVGKNDYQLASSVSFIDDQSLGSLNAIPLPESFQSNESTSDESGMTPIVSLDESPATNEQPPLGSLDAIPLPESYTPPTVDEAPKVPIVDGDDTEVIPLPEPDVPPVIEDLPELGDLPPIVIDPTPEKWDAKSMPDGVKILADLQEKYNEVSGKLDDSELQFVDEKIWGRHRLHPEAAGGLRAMNEAFKKEFGEDIKFTDSYRPYDEQVNLKDQKPALAATPGKSNHGWGLAVDFASDINSYTSKQHKWMLKNAAQFGFELPEWAREFDENGTANKQEPWHWEFTGSEALDVDYSKQAELRKAEESKGDKHQANDDKAEKIGNVNIETAERMAKLGGEMGRAGEIMLELLKNTKFTPGQAAGFIGNPMVEAPGLRANQKQYSGGPGRGIVQWEIGFYQNGEPKRGQDLLAFAEARGTTWDDFDTQIAFIIHELKGKEKHAYNKIREAKVVSEAAVLTRKFYERPGVHHDQRRIDAGLEVYKKFDEIRKEVQAEKDGQASKDKPDNEVLAAYENEKFSVGNEKNAKLAVERAWYYTEHLDEVTQKCGTTNCKGMCGRATAIAYGYSSTGFMTAKKQFLDADKKNITYSVDVGRGEAPNIGDLIYYEVSAANGWAGHVAIYVGDGKIVTNVSHETAYRSMSLKKAEELYGKNLGAAPGTNFRGAKDPNAVNPPERATTVASSVDSLNSDSPSAIETVVHIDDTAGEAPLETLQNINDPLPAPETLLLTPEEREPAGEVQELPYIAPREDEGAGGLLMIDHGDTVADARKGNGEEGVTPPVGPEDGEPKVVGGIKVSVAAQKIMDDAVAAAKRSAQG